MKTPDEIKKGLETCIGECTGNKPHCPYHECGNGCMDTMNKNSLAYIRQLEAEKAELLQKIEQLEKERDAAIKDIPRACGYCKHYVHSEMLCRSKYPCAHVSGVNTRWEWRGVCDENGGTP